MNYGIHYSILQNSMVLNFMGKTVVISNDDHRYEDVMNCIRNGNLNDIPAIVEVERAFEGTGLELRDGVLFGGDEAIPTELNARIMKHKDLGLPFEPLLKFWENLKLNPSYNSRQQLFHFLENNGHPLTDDGCFIAYRGVTEDFKDKHTRQFDNSVGAKPSMDRALVDDNPNNTCSRGLHVACYDYANGFGPQLIEVKVNPRDVVCVPTDYNGTKMRVCEFEVVAVGQNMRTESVYGQPEPVQPEETEEETEEEDDNSSCKNCGAPRDDWFTYCPDCGHEHGQD